MEMAASNGTLLDHYFNQPANPAGMPSAEMAGAEREIAKTIGERSALVDFDWQWVMRPMSHHYIGTGIDRGVCNVRHVLQRFAPEAPVARCDDNVDLRAQGLDVVAELAEIASVRSGHDRRRHTKPVCWRNAGRNTAHRHLVSGVAAIYGDPGCVGTGLAIGRSVN